MNTKQLTILLVVVGALIAAVVAKRLAPREELYQEEAESLHLEVDASAVDRIALRRGEEEGVALRRDGDRWRVTSLWDAKADEEKVQQFLTTVAGLTGEARGDSEELLGDFGITEAEALHLTLFSGETELHHLLVGTADVGWQRLFLRSAGSDTVYLVGTNLLMDIGLTGDLAEAKPTGAVWTDRSLFTFTPAEIERVEMKEPGAEWQEAGGRLPFARDEGKVQEYLQRLLILNGKAVVDPEGQGYGFEEPALQLRLVKKDGSPIVATLSSTDADHYLRLDETGATYALSDYTLGQIHVDGSRFIGGDPLGVSDTLNALTVRVPGEDISVSLEDERWDGLNTYLDEVKGFQVAKVDGLPDRATPDLTTPYQVELSHEQDVRTIACESPVDDAAIEIVCVNRKNDVPFLISRATFGQVFGQIGQLQRPQTSPESETDPASAVEPAESAE